MLAFVSLQERDGKIKTVESVLEAGLIEMANKEEELVVRRGDMSMSIEWTRNTAVMELRVQSSETLHLSRC